MSQPTAHAIGSAYTAHNLKDMVIQYVTLESDDGTLSSDFGIRALEEQCVLDPAGIDSVGFGSPIYEGDDLSAALSNCIKEFNNERASWTILKRELICEITRAEVLQLLDNDLIALGDLVPGILDLNIMQKARYLAMKQAGNGNVHLDLNGASLGRSRTEYSIVLTRVVAGYGRNLAHLELYFDYKTTLFSFLWTLKQETQLSIIPPVVEQLFDIDYEGPEWYKNLPRGNRPLTVPPPPKVFAINPLINGPQPPPGLATNPHVYNTNHRGYTLEHGPWMYRLRSSTKEQWGAWGYITDEESYFKMRNKIKNLRELAKQKDAIHMPKIFVSVMHSMDKQSMDGSQARMKQDALDDADGNLEWENLPAFDMKDGSENEAGTYIEAAMVTHRPKDGE